MFAVSPCLEGKKKKKLRGLHFPLRLQEAFLLQNCVLPRRLACQTVLFTQKLSQVCQGTEMPERNQGMPQPRCRCADIPPSALLETGQRPGAKWRRRHTELGRGPRRQLGSQPPPNPPPEWKKGSLLPLPFLLLVQCRLTRVDMTHSVSQTGEEKQARQSLTFRCVKI